MSATMTAKVIKLDRGVLYKYEIWIDPTEIRYSGS